MEKLLLKPDEVANVVGLGRTRVYTMLGTGLLPCIRIGSSVRVPADDLREWVAKQKREVTA